MSKSLNLYDFMHTHAEIIERTDKARGITRDTLPIAKAEVLESFLLQRRSYGQVRAADIAYIAYEEAIIGLQKQAFKGIFTAGVGPMITMAFATSGLMNFSTDLPLLLVAATPLPVGMTSYVMGIFYMRHKSRRFEAQFDQAGNVNPKAAVDRTQSARAHRFLRHYLSDEKFARKIAFGTGLIDPAPVAIKKIVRRIEIANRDLALH